MGRASTERLEETCLERGSRAEYDMRMRRAGGEESKRGEAYLGTVQLLDWAGRTGGGQVGEGHKQKTEKRAGLAFKGPSQGKKLTPAGFQRSVHVKSRKKPSEGGAKTGSACCSHTEREKKSLRDPK